MLFAYPFMRFISAQLVLNSVLVSSITESTRKVVKYIYKTCALGTIPRIVIYFPQGEELDISSKIFRDAPFKFCNSFS